MKKLIALLVATTVVTSIAGCGAFRRLRDHVCRGAYCGAPASAAPIVGPPEIAGPPLAAFDPGCGYDPGCEYVGAQTYGYGSVPMMGGGGFVPGCDTCGMGDSYALPSYGGGPSYDTGSYVVDPGASYPVGGGATVDPSPAPVE